MPILHIKKPDPHTILGIWAITETNEELLNALPPQLDKSALSALKHPGRQNEWLASRILVYHLLSHFTTEPLQLLRNEHGKPCFEKETISVSITHSSKLAAVILSDKYEVGIDVELIHAKALRVADKFLTDAERKYTEDNVKRTCLYWSAKETLYKMYSKKQLIFKEHLLLAPSVPENDNMLHGRIQTANFSKLYQIQHETVLDHILTYSTDTL